MNKIIILLTFFILKNEIFLQAQPEALKIGDMAPLFETKNHNGQLIKLDLLLQNGPVVLFFYRGSWCPYCNRQMSDLQDSVHLITAKGATVLAVSPETNESMSKIIEKSKADFTFISDSGYKIMDAYKVSFKLDEGTVKKYKFFGLNIEKANGNEDDILPVPATYVIGTDGTIKYVFFNTDYKKRASVNEILNHL